MNFRGSMQSFYKFTTFMGRVNYISALFLASQSEYLLCPLSFLFVLFLEPIVVLFRFSRATNGHI